LEKLASVNSYPLSLAVALGPGSTAQAVSATVMPVCQSTALFLSSDYQEGCPGGARAYKANNTKL